MRKGLQFQRPVRNVVLQVSHAPDVDAAAVARQREEAAYQRGIADGERSLSAQLMQQRNELLALQQGVLASLQGAMTTVKDECEQALIALTFEVASKLVAGLPVSVTMVEAAIREALAQVEEHTDYHLYLHPDDLEMLQQVNSPTLLPNVAGQRVHFHRATEIGRGGCIVKTRFGLVDATRESKLSLLQKSLLS